MPLITVKALGGRTIEQKRGLVKDITEAVVKNFKVTPDSVTVDIIEYTKDNLAKAGTLFVDRQYIGGETGTRFQSWHVECSCDFGESAAVNQSGLLSYAIFVDDLQ